MLVKTQDEIHPTRPDKDMIDRVDVILPGFSLYTTLSFQPEFT